MGAEKFAELVAYLRARDDADPDVAPEMRSRALRGEPGRGAIVLLHGLTASPPAWRAIAQELHARGHTVVILRLALHGHRDRMTTALRDLGARALVADVAAVIAQVAALGERVTVAGHSLGATLALDAAARGPSVARVVAIAPFLGLVRVPHELHRVVRGLLVPVRNRFLWWDPVQRERLQPAHGYPRYPLGALLAGLEIADDIRRLAPHADAVDIVLNARESSVSNRTARRLAERWRAAAASVAIHHLRGLGWSHDIIEPERPHARAVLETLVAIVSGEHVPEDREHRVGVSGAQ